MPRWISDSLKRMVEKGVAEIVGLCEVVRDDGLVLADGSAFRINGGPIQADTIVWLTGMSSRCVLTINGNKIDVHMNQLTCVIGGTVTLTDLSLDGAPFDPATSLAEPKPELTWRQKPAQF